MKLAEALIRRHDLKSKIDELESRLVSNALVQEGETPAEAPEALTDELRCAVAQYKNLIARINLTNTQYKTDDGTTMTELLADRECRHLELKIIRRFLDQASSKCARARGSEIRIKSTVDVAEYQKKSDKMCQSLRQLEFKIQELNWKIDLAE